MSNIGNQELGDIVLGAPFEDETFTAGSGQAQADIKQTYRVYGQSQADIKQTYNQHAQAQAWISIRTFVSGQAQARIHRTQGYGQAQADIKQTYPLCTGDASSGAAILGSMVLGATQLGSTSEGNQVCLGAFGQALALIGVNKYAHGQSQADIKAIGYGFGQAQAEIKQTYYVHGQAQGSISRSYFAHGQAQAYILAHPYAHGQAQADIKAVGYGFGQAQADIKQTYYGHGQAQALIGQRSNVHGQAQADIKAINNGHGQAQADIKQIYYGHGQAQGTIKTTYNQHGQAQGTIVNTYFAHGQAQAYILAHPYAHGQAQGDIKQTYRVHGQSQGYIQIAVFVHGQAQADIKAVGYAFGQAQAKIQSGINLVHGQAQATIIPQYIHFLDTFSRTVATVDTVPSMNPPDYGIYSGVSTVNPAGSIDGSKVIVPYGSFEALYVGNVPVDIVDGSTLSMQFKATDYVSTDDFYFEVSIGNQDVPDGAVVLYTDSGQIYLFGGTNFDSAPFVPGNGFTYKFLLYSSPTEVKAKVWLYDDGLVTYPEPAAWTLQTTNNVSFTGISAFFYALIFTGGNSGTLEIDNVSIYAPEPPAWLAFGQAQALIRRTIAHGQAQARIKKVDFNRHGQARAFIRKSAGYGQAQALITKAAFRSGQAQAYIDTPGMRHGQAQALITTTRPTGQAQGYIKNTWFPVGQAQAHILQKQWIMGQAQALIKYAGNVVTGQALGLIHRTQGYGQAQAFIDGTETVWVVGQAQAYIIKTQGYGQAQADIKRTNRGHGQALALIIRRQGYGQAQGLVRKGTETRQYGQAQAFIRYQPWAFAQAQALIRKGAGYGQAQARIRAFGQFGWGTAQAFIRRTDTLIKSGQAQAAIKRNDPVGQAQALIEGGRYLVNYNGYQMPGYAQVEDYVSPASVYEPDVTYQDGPFSEYIGLDNKTIALQMKVIGGTYADVKTQVQTAATIFRSSKGWEKLYIFYYDRYYTALAKRINTEKRVAESMRALDYGLEWEAKPWLTSDAVNTVSGVGTISTGPRDLEQGGWTPAKIRISGTDVTISGYNQYGEFTGFVSISGTVTDMIINTEEYTSTINGVNSNNQMYNPDYAVFVGPGETFFVVTGASSCTIEWQDRWYL